MPKPSQLPQVKPSQKTIASLVIQEKQFQGIQQSLRILGQSLLHNPENSILSASVKKGTLKPDDYYHQLLYIIFRLIFLCIAEDNDGLLLPITSPKKRNKYIHQYSLTRLRKKMTEPMDKEGTELWSALCSTMDIFHRGHPNLGIPACNSRFWSPKSCAAMTSTQCSNHDLERTIRALCIITVQGKNLDIKWKNFPSMLLGSFYERLLDLIPSFENTHTLFELKSQRGSKRKSTGAYYTPQPLIETILASVIDPIIEKAIANKNPSDAAKAILALRICDPSCGSGHFLIAAAHRLALKLARQQEQNQNPSSKSIQVAKRDVIHHCIFGVDRNPMAVDLCIMALWMESMDEGKTMGFFQKNIQQGDALLGIRPDMLLEGIKTEYFHTITNHDQRTVANTIRAKNRKARKTAAKSSHTHTNESRIADTLLAAMLWPKRSGMWEDNAPTHDVWNDIRSGILHPKVDALVQQLKRKYSFFHWHVAFSNILSHGGFDAIIGNPPYLDSEHLKKNHPYERQALSALYESTIGNWDIYIPFTELSVRLLKKGGRQGLVTPNKILGSDYAKALQKRFFFEYRLCSIHDFSLQSMFSGASVAVVIAVIEKSASSPQPPVQYTQYLQGNTPHKTASSTIEELRNLPHGYISFPLTCPKPYLIQWLNHEFRMQDVATLSDGATTSEAYGIQKLVHHGNLHDSKHTCKIKMINTGTIDPFQLLWGEKSISYLGYKGHFPVISASLLQKNYPKRYQQSQKTKVVIAGMSKRLEAAVAPPSFLCGKSAVLLIPNINICPYAITTLLNSQSYVQLYIGFFAMRGMSGTSFNIGPRQIEQLPIPPKATLSSCDANIVQSIQEGSPIELHIRRPYTLSLLGKLLHAEKNNVQKQAYISMAEKIVSELMNTGK